LSEVVIQGASWVDERGYGNDLIGFRPWPAAIQESILSGSPEEAHWSVIFQSDPGRFGRMDLMSRLGLMATELLEARIREIPEELRQRVGVCVETTVGSLSTDLKFLQTPRASLFSYTLPSTVIGEICIRYRARGPVLCFVKSEPDEPALGEAVRLVQEDEASACICLTCDALEAEAVKTLSAPALWKGARWQAAALLLGKRTGAACEHTFAGRSVRANAANLCKPAEC
jgi:3-oxoacyl-(acyl-carrier-protein) synthase